MSHEPRDSPPVHLFWPTTPQTPGYRLHADDRELFDSYFNLLHRLRLFGTRQQRRSRKSHPSCLALLDPFPVCCIDQIDLFIPYFFQLFNEGLHVSIFCLREDVMNGKSPAFFSRSAMSPAGSPDGLWTECCGRRNCWQLRQRSHPGNPNGWRLPDGS